MRFMGEVLFNGTLAKDAPQAVLADRFLLGTYLLRWIYCAGGAETHPLRWSADWPLFVAQHHHRVHTRESSVLHPTERKNGAVHVLP